MQMVRIRPSFFDRCCGQWLPAGPFKRVLATKLFTSLPFYGARHSGSQHVDVEPDGHAHLTRRASAANNAPAPARRRRCSRPHCRPPSLLADGTSRAHGGRPRHPGPAGNLAGCRGQAGGRPVAGRRAGAAQERPAATGVVGDRPQQGHLRGAAHAQASGARARLFGVAVATSQEEQRGGLLPSDRPAATVPPRAPSSPHARVHDCAMPAHLRRVRRPRAAPRTPLPTATRPCSVSRLH
jgi:hypothetical protein